MTAIASARDDKSHGEKATPAGGHGHEPPGAEGAAGKVYYHGVGPDGRAGHSLWKPGQGWSCKEPEGFPCKASSLDGCFLPPGQQVEGKASLWSVDDGAWTILAFWDRSGDSRGNSNSAFVIRDDLGLRAAIEIARESFPEIWDRMNFEVR